MSLPLTLLIINWNARQHLEACLGAALPVGCPIVVVDNASADGSAAFVRATYPDVTLIASPANLGFAGGVNAGVAATTTPWVLVLNPDVRVSPPAVHRLVAAASADPRIGAAGACLTAADGTPQRGFAVRRFPTLGSLAADLLLVDKLWPGNPASRRYHARDVDLATDQDVDQPAAACLLIRRAAFDAVGGFDERFHPAWWEDVDFCRRLRTAAWRVRYVADARIVHEGGVAMDALGLGRFTRVWYENMRRYVDTHFSRTRRVVFRALLASGMLLRAGVSAATARPTDALTYLAVIPVALRRE